ncbi:MarR family winged helix-turn-helix transcriptional regulator [Amycolatopsis vancoresmycina]|uniref:HTH marR-type domain-containing protein n=1 Tax=Amycolatopsis vancoresmycina DSM 44592 TaxID=1292037 RepID=R1I242_9PSEU|nr:MarR family transcriptional regulator [Amycolatopsis vancoresmycina]EOD64494.1 hypothetical protein H480_31551 [Amycolatopsis vancoresmycina DSM 44592]
MREDVAAGPQAGTSLTSALTTAARGVAAVVEAVLKPDGLGLDHWLVLQALAAGEGLTMTELAGDTLVTGPTLTRVVDRLVTNALVYREVAPEDRRRVRVYLSPRGKAAHKRLAARVHETEERLLTGHDEGFVTALTALRQAAKDG